MKKKTIIRFSLLITIIVFAIPVVGFLFLVYFPLEPETKGKICEAIKFIDLKKLPKGRFQKVGIVSITPISDQRNYEQIIFEVPADKMTEFETGFRRCVQNAMPLEGIITCISPKLKIRTEKGKYSAYIYCDDNSVIVFGGTLFHRGFSSGELRKVFYDAGLKYDSEKQPAHEREKDVNQP